MSKEFEPMQIEPDEAEEIKASLPKPAQKAKIVKKKPLASSASKGRSKDILMKSMIITLIALLASGNFVLFFMNRANLNKITELEEQIKYDEIRINENMLTINLTEKQKNDSILKFIDFENYIQKEMNDSILKRKNITANFSNKNVQENVKKWITIIENELDKLDKGQSAVNTTYEKERKDFYIEKSKFESEKAEWAIDKANYITEKTNFDKEKLNFDAEKAKLLNDKEAFAGLKTKLDEDKKQYELNLVKFQSDKARFEAENAKYLQAESKYKSLVNEVQWIYSLENNHSKVYSQNAEDGILLEIIKHLNVTNKYYVEFGVEDGNECNSRILRENYGWKGLLMDGSYENLAINLRKEYVSPDNINALFEKYNVPEKFGFLGIDIDMDTFWVFKAVNMTKYRPDIIMLEINQLAVGMSKSVKPPDVREKEGLPKFWGVTYVSGYFGASLSALKKQAALSGYSLVFCERSGINCFWARNELLGFDINEVLHTKCLWRVPSVGGPLVANSEWINDTPIGFYSTYPYYDQWIDV